MSKKLDQLHGFLDLFKMARDYFSGQTEMKEFVEQLTKKIVEIEAEIKGVEDDRIASLKRPYEEDF